MGKEESTLTPLEKAAVIVSSLPEELASEVLRHLDVTEIERLSSCMARMETVHRETVNEAIGEFVQMAIQGKETVSLGKDYTENLVSKVLGADAAKSMVEKAAEGKTHRTLDLLERLDAKTLTELTGNEHPQTIALILSHLSPEKAGGVLSNLPEELRAEVILRISNLEGVPLEIVNEVVESLESEAKSIGSVGQKLGGIKVVADILNQMDHDSESIILDKIEETDPTMANEIRQLMFIFDDLILIDDRGIQEILKEVTNDDLARALKTASEPVKEKIFNNMSERAVEMLNEDIEDMGPVRLSEVEKAQNTVAQVAMRLEGEGKIVMGSRGGEEVFV
jgi:flagellar motor switch protein FliG